MCADVGADVDVDGDGIVVDVIGICWHGDWFRLAWLHQICETIRRLKLH